MYGNWDALSLALNDVTSLSQPYTVDIASKLAHLGMERSTLAVWQVEVLGASCYPQLIFRLGSHPIPPFPLPCSL